MKALLLPGLDGTGELFARFTGAAPAEIDCLSVRYPDDSSLGYSQYASLVLRHHLPREPFLLVAESFSGPVGVLLASQQPENLVGIVLCNTFIVPPAWRLIGLAPWSIIFRTPITKAMVGLHLTGLQRASDFTAAVRDANRSVSPSTRAARLKAVFSVDVRREFAGLSVPVLILRGTRDRLVFSGSVKRMLSVRASARLAELDGPHLLLQVAPEGCWDAIMDFRSRIQTA
jgi:pimeloyl-ACP methyl ester carboxylesterase